jgi:hypothetical protein
MFHNGKLNKLWNNIDWPRKLIEFSASKPSPNGTRSTSAPPPLERCCTWWEWWTEIPLIWTAYLWKCMSYDQRDIKVTYLRNLNFRSDFCSFRLRKNIIFNKTESLVGRNTSDRHACQIVCSKSNCETMYHLFFLLETIVVKIMNNLNVCSAYSYLYPRLTAIYTHIITSM